MTIERRVRIVNDSNPCNPRTEYDCHVGRMLCWHPRYTLGDKHSYDSDDCKRELACEADDDLEETLDNLEYDVWEVLTHCLNKDSGHDDPNGEASRRVSASQRDLIDRAFDAGYVALPLYLYDHSGITMNTSGFNSLWDSGCVGVIVCDKETIDREFAGDRDLAEKALESEVEVYNQYLTGDVWGFIAEERCSEACSECSHHEDWNETDSCWGFYGSDPGTNGMKESLCDDYHDAMLDASVEYQ